MNRPNRHMRYRRSVYRKKRIKIIVISSLCAIAVLVLLFMIIGNALGDKVEENVTKRSDKNTAAEQKEHADVKSVVSYPVPLSSSDSKLSTRLSRISADGYSAVCFDLDSPDGTLLYSSPISQTLGKQSSGGDLWKLEDAVKLCKDNGLYATGIVHIRDFNNDDDLARSAALGYYAAQISEALRAGVDEVLIFAKDVPIDRYSELLGLAQEVHRLCPDGIVGISLPSSVYSEAYGTADMLWAEFDYLAVDASVPPEGTDAADHVSNCLGSMLYYLLRYNVRVLVPLTEDTALYDRIVDAVTSNGSNNIQIMPQ